MEESSTSISDARITSLITTSITDMVRQEVGKIMVELNMPVCNEAIDRIIAENLDKEVEKQNFVKTYKRKVNQLNQYKCIEKRADPDELVIVNLKLIESRVKRLEDFVVQNLMQRPELIQDLAGRSVESLTKNVKNEIQEQKPCEEIELKKEEKIKIEEVKINRVKKEEITPPTVEIERIEENIEKKEKFKPASLNLDDVIKVIRECPETQDSFDIFQSAAERIKHDLERFIQDYKRDLGEKTRRRGIDASTAAISRSTSPDLKKTYTVEQPKEGASIGKRILKTEDSIKSAEIETVVLNKCDERNEDQTHITVSDEAKKEIPLIEKQSKETKLEKEKQIVIMEEKVENTKELPKDLKTENSKNEKSEKSEKIAKPNQLVKPDAKKLVTFAQQIFGTCMAASGDRRTEFRTLQQIKSTELTKETELSKESKHTKSENDTRECKECKERMKFTNERNKTSAIDDDIKWKLDKILDQIGDFCNRSKGGKDLKPDAEIKVIQLSAYEAQPGTSTEFNKRKLIKHNLSKPKQEVNKPMTTNIRNDRKKMDKMLDQVRFTSHNSQQRQGYKLQEVVVTDVKAKLPEPPQKVKPKKTVEVRKTVELRKSVEAFKNKWGLQYNKSLAAKTNTENAQKNIPKTPPYPARNVELVARTQMKRSPEIEMFALPLQKSSTTIMLESIDKFARSTAINTTRMARTEADDDDITWVYSKRAQPRIPQVNFHELPNTKVLYHNYKL